MGSSPHSASILSASVTAATLLAIGVAGLYLPVGKDEQHAARVLSTTGPRGAIAYRHATADGVLTASDMQKIRDASGLDLDQPEGLDKSAQRRR